MIWLLAGVALLAIFLLFVRWYVDAEPRDLLKVLRLLGGLFAAGVAGLAVASGKLTLLWLVLLGLLPWIGRLRALNRQADDLRGPRPGQRIDRRTGFVVIYMNPETGDMDGRVLKGPQSGKLLSELSIDALVTLYEAAQLEDEEAAAAIEAFLDRMHGQAWREKAKGAAAMIAYDGGAGVDEDDQAMSRAQAYSVLGLEPGASRKDIQNACDRLVELGHPDAGTAAEIAERAQRAKTILLNE